MGVESPEKRCGKTTLLSVLSELVSRPVVAANISSPAFFRVIEEARPTWLIDEADTWLQGNEMLRGILNSGYTRKTAFVVRVAQWARKARRGRGGGAGYWRTDETGAVFVLVSEGDGIDWETAGHAGGPVHFDSDATEDGWR